MSSLSILAQTHKHGLGPGIFPCKEVKGPLQPVLDMPLCLGILYLLWLACKLCFVLLKHVYYMAPGQPTAIAFPGSQGTDSSTAAQGGMCSDSSYVAAA